VQLDKSVKEKGVGREVQEPGTSGQPWHLTSVRDNFHPVASQEPVDKMQNGRENMFVDLGKDRIGDWSTVFLDMDYSLPSSDRGEIGSYQTDA